MLSENPVGKEIYPSQIPSLWLRDERYIFSPKRSEGGLADDFKKLPSDLITDYDWSEVENLIKEETGAVRDVMYTLSSSEYGKGLSFYVENATCKPKAGKPKTNNFRKLLLSTNPEKIRNVSSITMDGKGTKLTTSDKDLNVVLVEGVKVGTDNLEAFMTAMNLLGKGTHLIEIEEMEKLFGIKKKRKSEPAKEKRKSEPKGERRKAPKVNPTIPEPMIIEPVPLGDVKRIIEKRVNKKEKQETKEREKRKLLGKAKDKEEEIEFLREEEEAVEKTKSDKFRKLLLSTDPAKIRNVSTFEKDGKGKVTSSDKGLKIVSVEGIQVGTNNLEAFVAAMDVLGKGSYDSEIEEMEKLFGVKRKSEPKPEKPKKKRKVETTESEAESDDEVSDEGDVEPERYIELGDIDEGEPIEFGRRQSLGSMEDFLVEEDVEEQYSDESENEGETEFEIETEERVPTPKLKRLKKKK
jgi:hypothetical protein